MEPKKETKAAGAEDLQKQVDKAEDQGFVGIEVDPTPNEHYTVAGVTSGKPTPETDAGQAAKAQQAARELSVNNRNQRG